MTIDSQPEFWFQPGIPVPGVPPGTNILVSGDRASGVRQIGLELVSAATSREGMLLLAADVDGRTLVERLDEIPRPVNRSLLGVVDCSGAAVDEDDRFVAYADPISDPGDLTAVELEFSRLYETLSRDDPPGIRIGVFSLASLLANASFKDVSRFLHMLTGRIVATGDLGVFVADATAQDARSVEALGHFCDVHVEVRAADGDTEIRTSGLADRQAEWEPVDFEVARDDWIDRIDVG